MSTTCACPQCCVSRAAFGTKVPAADAYVAGINTLAAVVAIQIARLDDDALNEVIALIVAHRAEARRRLAEARAGVDGLASAEVVGHG